MLISQRIVKDLGFLKAAGPNDAGKAKFFLNLRKDVLSSVKIFIDDYGMAELREKGKNLDAFDRLFGDNTLEERKKRAKIYSEFARPPFPCVLLESDQFVLLVKELKDAPGEAPAKVSWTSAWSMVLISNTGDVAPLAPFVALTPDAADIQRVYTYITPWILNRADELSEEFVKETEEMCGLYSRIAMDALTMMNCRNVEFITYKPSNRELAHFVPSLRPHFTYRILDIHRTRKVYTSLDAMAADGWQPVKKIEGREHLVRGHFKKKKNGVFWWNPHIRNAKNADTLGVVAKDYRLIDK